MDLVTLAAAIGIIKTMPDTAASRAEAAAEEAKEASSLAQEYGYLITVEDNALVIGLEDNDNA